MTTWDDIETLLLDLDGTLLDLRFDSHFWLEHLPRRYAELNGLSAEIASAHIHARIRRERGSLNWYCVEYWSREFDVDIIALKREIAHLISVHHGAEDFLREAKRAGKRMVLVTNAHAASLELKMEKTELGAYFDAMVCSHAFGAPKEDSRFWSQLARRSPFEPDRTLFVDDSIAVLRAARAFGLDHVVAVRRPDSTAPAQVIDEFPAVDAVSEILGFEAVPVRA